MTATLRGWIMAYDRPPAPAERGGRCHHHARCVRSAACAGRDGTGAWAGMGYACAQDRLFQMDYDRRRAWGRWAEIAGFRALGADVLARRLGLTAAAQLDVAAMSPQARACSRLTPTGSTRPSRTARGRCPRATPSSPGSPGTPSRRSWCGTSRWGSGSTSSRTRCCSRGPAPAPSSGWRAGRSPGRRSRRRPTGGCPPGRRAARRGARRHRRAPRVPRRGRAGIQRVGRQRAAHRARRRGDLQRLAPGARHPERVLAVPGDLPGLRRHRGHLPRAARVPALRVQRVGRVGDHARGRRHAGPVPGAVRGDQVPDAVRLGGGRAAGRGIDVRGGDPRSPSRCGPPGTGPSCTGTRQTAWPWCSSGRAPTGPTGGSSACCRCSPRGRAPSWPTRRTAGSTRSTTWSAPTTPGDIAYQCRGELPVRLGRRARGCRCPAGTGRASGREPCRSRRCRGPSTPRPGS